MSVWLEMPLQAAANRWLTLPMLEQDRAGTTFLPAQRVLLQYNMHHLLGCAWLWCQATAEVASHNTVHTMYVVLRGYGHVQ